MNAEVNLPNTDDVRDMVVCECFRGQEGGGGGVIERGMKRGREKEKKEGSEQ